MECSGVKLANLRCVNPCMSQPLYDVSKQSPKSSMFRAFLEIWRQQTIELSRETDLPQRTTATKGKTLRAFGKPRQSLMSQPWRRRPP